MLNYVISYMLSCNLFVNHLIGVTFWIRGCIGIGRLPVQTLLSTWPVLLTQPHNEKPVGLQVKYKLLV